MTPEKNLIGPTALNERIISLDILRGIAVLGILIMNIQNFAMPGAAYLNPTAYGDLNGINKWVWIISHVLGDNKFMTIFSILFGAGIILFSERAMDKGRKVSAFHYRRMFWLLVFGLMHAYLIWSGDILVAYSLCGMFVFLFRKSTPKTLIIVASIFFVIPFFMNLMAVMTMPMWPEESYNENLQMWLPSAELIKEQIANYQGGWLQQMNERIETSIMMQSIVFFYLMFWRVTALMLLGMALFKSGVLSAKKSNVFYIRMILIGLLLGFSLSIFGIYKNFEAKWFFDYSMYIGVQYNYWGSIGVSLGYIAIIMLIAKSARFNRFKYLFSSVGKMAFTNYILMSLLGMFIFYGNGFGLFGQIERQYQILFVFGIWIIILILSPLWLSKFRFGPLEWFWRVLTYWKNQPLKK